MNINNIGDDKKELVMVHAWNVVTNWGFKKRNVWAHVEHAYNSCKEKMIFSIKKRCCKFVIIP